MFSRLQLAHVDLSQSILASNARRRKASTLWPSRQSSARQHSLSRSLRFHTILASVGRRNECPLLLPSWAYRAPTSFSWIQSTTSWRKVGWRLLLRQERLCNKDGQHQYSIKRTQSELIGCGSDGSCRAVFWALWYEPAWASIASNSGKCTATARRVWSISHHVAAAACEPSPGLRLPRLGGLDRRCVCAITRLA